MQLRATAHHSNRVSQASVQVGDATILRIEERLGPAVPPEILLPGLDLALLREHVSWLEPQHRDPATGLLVISIHSWLLRTGSHTILIDACAGNDKQRLRPESAEFHEQRAPWLERLAAQGVRPEDVDFVMCTHLHVDHVGWNTRLVDGAGCRRFRTRNICARGANTSSGIRGAACCRRMQMTGYSRTACSPWWRRALPSSWTARTSRSRACASSRHRDTHPGTSSCI